MGYTTDFDGWISIEPALSSKEVDFLTKFAESRRMDRKNGPYFVDGDGFNGQRNSGDVIDNNRPPHGQPSLWCQWVPTIDGESIEWDGNEKFYESPEWMDYLIQHFLRPNAFAHSELPFLQGHTLNGTIAAQGEDPNDMWLLHVKDNRVSTEGLVAMPSGEINDIGEEVPLLTETKLLT